MGKSQNLKKVLLYLFVSIFILAFQKLLSKVGGIIADLIPYEIFDSDNAFAWVSIHHLVVMIVSFFIIIVLGKVLKINFNLGMGDKKIGFKYVTIFTFIFTVITFVCHILMLIYKMLPVYTYPLNKTNIIGTMGFQLFLSGPAEEILYRALPIAILIYTLGKSKKVLWGLTIETIVAAFLFALAHAKLSLYPFEFEANYFQLIYAFVLGIFAGKVYQESQSIVYPMLIHSISNVLMIGVGYIFLLL